MFPFLNAQHWKVLAEIARENDLPVANFTACMAGKPTEESRLRLAKGSARYPPTLVEGISDQGDASAAAQRLGEDDIANMLAKLKMPSKATHTPSPVKESREGTSSEGTNGGGKNTKKKKKKKPHLLKIDDEKKKQGKGV
jgi:hypothetical protein